MIFHRRKKLSVKVGQIYEDKHGKYVITKIVGKFVYYVYNDGMVDSCHIEGIIDSGDRFIAKYPDWRSAVQSSDFNRVNIWV